MTKRLPKELTELKDGTIEVRMPMALDETLYEESPYYHVRNVSVNGTFSKLAYVAVNKNSLGYSIVRFFDLPGERRSTISFAFTKKGADELAHEKALSLAHQIAKVNGLYLRDFSQEDKRNLANLIRESEGDKK